MLLTTIGLLASAITFPASLQTYHTRIINSGYEQGQNGSVGLIVDTVMLDHPYNTDLQDGIVIYQLDGSNNGLYMGGYVNETSAHIEIRYDLNLSTDASNVAGYCYVNFENADDQDDDIKDYFGYNFLDYQNNSPLYTLDMTAEQWRSYSDELWLTFYSYLESEEMYNIATGDMGGYYQNGYQAGYNEGESNGYDIGAQEGYNEGYQVGYSAGYTEADTMDTTALTIFTGIINVALLPINFFLQVLNFEVFGINIGALVTSLMTVAIIIIIIRLVTGKKND